jgi:hypothetical protein
MDVRIIAAIKISTLMSPDEDGVALSIHCQAAYSRKRKGRLVGDTPITTGWRSVWRKDATINAVADSGTGQTATPVGQQHEPTFRERNYGISAPSGWGRGAQNAPLTELSPILIETLAIDLDDGVFGILTVDQQDTPARKRSNLRILRLPERNCVRVHQQKNRARLSAGPEQSCYNLIRLRRGPT